MSLKELESVTFKLASEIKDEKIVCRIDGIRRKVDRHGRDVVVLRLSCKGYGNVISVYSPQKARMLVEAFKQIGISEDTPIIGKCFEWKRTKVPKVREDYTEPYPVYLPTKEVPCQQLEV